MKANGREPRSSLGQDFNFKLGCFVMSVIAWHVQAHPHLELKTQPRFHPVSLRLSMDLQAWLVALCLECGGIIEQVSSYKSSLVLMIQIQITQTLQLFTKVIKTESIYKSY